MKKNRPHPKLPRAIAEDAVRPPPSPGSDYLDCRLIRTSIEELERRPAFYYRGEPLEPNWETWKEFKTFVQEDDELWLFDAPKEDWHIGMGSCGVLLVRNGKCVRVLTLAFN